MLWEGVKLAIYAILQPKSTASTQEQWGSIMEHPFYNNVGVVKSENNSTSPDAPRKLSRAPEVGRSSKTLDKFRRAHTMETGTKRNVVQMSFVPYQDSFVGV